MKKTFLLGFAAAIVAAMSPIAHAETIVGEVVRVADGDTVTIFDDYGRKHRVRFLGIDAPEKDQNYGKQCRQNLVDKIGGQYVSVEYDKKDRYGRILGTVFFEERNINYEQVQDGCAWFYRYYAKDVDPLWANNYELAEEDAREGRIGLWQGKWPVAPWDFRRRSRGR